MKITITILNIISDAEVGDLFKMLLKNKKFENVY